MKCSSCSYRMYLFTIIALILLVSCTNDNDKVTEPNSTSEINPIELEFEEPPFDLQGNEALFARNVAYGPYEDNVFDIFLVDSDEPTPLVIYIHGGGFTSGDKGVVYLSARNEIRDILSSGASYATINYRLLDEMDDEGIIKSLTDSKRCLQFLRYHHEQLNIDPSQIALYGTSAGAGICLWLAFSDEMADSDTDDPPFWVRNSIENAGVPVDRNELFHHALHAMALKDRADDLGVQNQAYIPPLEVSDPAGESVVEFMIDQLMEDKP